MHILKNKQTKDEKDLIIYFEEKKCKDKEYLIEIENFLDRVDNIQDEYLKKEVIHKMHRVEKILIRIVKDILNECTE